MKRWTAALMAAAVLLLVLPAIASAGKECAFTGWKNGFTIVDESGDYALLITGGMQQRAQLHMPEEGEEKPEFSLEKGRVILKGHVIDKRLKFLFQYELSNQAATQFKLLHARVDYAFADEFQLRAGRQKVGFARGHLTGWMKRLTKDVSIATMAFARKFDTGMKAVGSFRDHLVEYEVGAWNGNGATARANDDTNLLYSGKVLLNPFGPVACDETGLAMPEEPLLSVGGKFYRNRLDYRTAVDAETGAVTVLNPVTDITAFGGEALFNWKKVVAQAEYFTRKTEPENGTDRTDNGFYLQAGVFPVPSAEKLQFFGRYSMIDWEGDPEDKEITAGANYYLRKNNWKIGASYSTVTKDSGTEETTNDKIVLEMQIYI